MGFPTRPKAKAPFIGQAPSHKGGGGFDVNARPDIEHGGNGAGAIDKADIGFSFMKVAGEAPVLALQKGKTWT